MGDGLCAKSGLEVGQLVVSAFVGLVAGQGQGLVLVWEAFKYSNVHEVIIIHLNLERQSSEGRVWPPTPAPLASAGLGERPWVPGGHVPSGDQRLG